VPNFVTAATGFGIDRAQPKRKQSISWKDFIRAHRDVLVGMDFFTTEVLTLRGLTTYYVLFYEREAA